mgnify:CR=1 FL=1
MYVIPLSLMILVPALLHTYFLLLQDICGAKSLLFSNGSTRGY